MAEDHAKTLRLAIYARVSTEEQREGQTIDSQIAEVERFARERAWIITGIYKDEGWSGGVLARPELDHLRDDATKSIFDAVLINDVDRLARDVTHLGVVKRDLERKGIQVIFRKLPSDNSPTHNLMINILGSFAEFEREMIADRTRRGRVHKVEVRQKYLGSNTAYGYRYIAMDRTAGKEGILEILPEEAAVVRQMFRWVDQESFSARQILVRLNELQIPPRKGAKTWAKSSVLRTLHNEMYAGIWYYNKFQAYESQTPEAPSTYHRHVKSRLRERSKNEWIPLVLPESLRIIERAQWQRVQEQLQRNIAFSPRHEKHFYLLKSLVRCGGCGARYVGEPSHGRYYYRCLARCRQRPSITEEHLNEPVWNAVVKAMLNPDLITQQVAESRQTDDTAAEQSASERAQTEHRLHQIASEEARLLEAYRLAVITPAQLGAELERLSARKHSLESRRDQLIAEFEAPSAPDIRDSVLDYCREAAANIEQFTHEEKKRFLRLLLTGIVFEGRMARISGIIPMSRGGKHNEESDDAGPGPGLSVRRIVTPKVNLRELNPGSGTHFELTADIPPIQIERFVDARGRFCKREQAAHTIPRQLTQPRKRAA